jgi:hypothetical protein
MQTTDLPTTSAVLLFDDVDGDGFAAVSRMRDYVKVRVSGGFAGPSGATANLDANEAARLGEALIALAADARTYAAAHFFGGEL